MLEEILSIRKHLPTDPGVTSLTPETPVLLIGPEIERVARRRGNRHAAKMQRGVWFDVCHLHAI
jgi:hypothetical protein